MAETSQPETPLDWLVCAATLFELKAHPTAKEFTPENLKRGFTRRGNVGFLETGVGTPAALQALFDLLPRLPVRQILQIGIAGAYPNSRLAIGDIALGVSEVYGDIGFELPEEPHFQSIYGSPFAGTLYQEPLPLFLAPEWNLKGTPQARGCTVHACTGTGAQGALRETVWQAGFETMEGAAVAQAGARFGVPVCEVRSISNIAAKRDMRPENIRLAIESLSRYLAACKKVTS